MERQLGEAGHVVSTFPAHLGPAHCTLLLHVPPFSPLGPQQSHPTEGLPGSSTGEILPLPAQAGWNLKAMNLPAL